MYVLFADWMLSVGSEICTLYTFKTTSIDDDELGRRAMAHILLYLCHLLVVSSLVFHRLMGASSITSIDSILWFLSSTVLLTFLCYRLSHDDEDLGNVMAWLVEILFRLFAVYFEFSRRAGNALDLADNAIFDSFGESDIIGGDLCAPGERSSRSRSRGRQQEGTVGSVPNGQGGYIEVYLPTDEHGVSCATVKLDPNDIPPSYDEVTKDTGFSAYARVECPVAGTSGSAGNKPVDVVPMSVSQELATTEPPPYEAVGQT